MKSRIILFFSCCFIISSFIQRAVAQQFPFGHNFLFKVAISDSKRSLGYAAEEFGYHDDNISGASSLAFSERTHSRSLAIGVKLNPTLTYYQLPGVTVSSKYYPAYSISDSSGAIMIALGINKDNVKNYRYHVVSNDNGEVIHWSKIPRLEQNYGAKTPYGFIGKFKYPGKQVMVEIVNVTDTSDRDGVVFDWPKKLKPYITNFVISAPPLNKADSLRGVRASPEFDNDHDPVTQMVSNLSFVQGAVGNMQLYVRPHKGIPYNVSLVKKDGNHLIKITKVDSDKLKNHFSFNLHDLEAGKYVVIIQPTDSWGHEIDGQETYLAIKVKPLPIIDRKIPVKQILFYIIGSLIIISLLFWMYRRQANLRLAQLAIARQNVNLKMRSIRAQLNPHFMFNALTSIQNLVNKKDMEGANHYLSRFASLTRKVLNTGEKELISLEDELKILDDYLQMERLRFGFQYRIEADPNVNLANTEVPAMLLQPFVENAIKHGVADLRECGEITLAIRRENNNLNLIIIDTGLGFKQKRDEKSNNSFGLKLSEERIELLNELYTGKPFSLNIKTGEGGTAVTITLANWIS